jgi:hypothetical protein
MECVEYFVDQNPINSADKVSFTHYTDDNGELNITTVEVTDIVFLSALLYGRIFLPEEDLINNLYTKGIAEVMRDCLQDVSKNEEGYKASALHEIVFNSFQESWGKIDIADADLLLFKMDDQ